MVIKVKYIIAGCAISLSATAGTMGVSTTEEKHTWSAILSLGYSEYQNMFQNDGQTELGRIAIGKELFTNNYIALGLELGIQNGNNMRLDIPQETLNELGGAPIQSTIKPMMDLLATVKTTTLSTSPFFALVKGGVGYRRWQFENRNTVNDLAKFAGELQAGLGYSLNQSTSLSLLYQGIYGNNPNFTVDTVNFVGHVSSIPTQQGVLLSLSYTV